MIDHLHICNILVVLLGRPQVGVKQYERQWQQLLADMTDKPPVHCAAPVDLSPPKSPDSPPLASVVLVHHNREVFGSCTYRGLAHYTKHESRRMLQMQDHGDRQPVRFRNIWIRRLDLTDEEAAEAAETK